MLVVAVTVVGSLTFLPATLSFLGEKNWLEKGRVPFVTRRRHQTKGESRVWGAIPDRVLRRPPVPAPAPAHPRRRHQTKGESRVWGAILDRVLRRPLVSALLAGGVLVALSIPAL